MAIDILLFVLLVAVCVCALVVTAGLRLAAPVPRDVGPGLDLLPAAENVRIPSASGSILGGWWLAGTRPGGAAVVLMHGVRRSRLNMVKRAQVLHAHGFAVLLFDFQAHGESPGKHITFGRLEAMDAAAAVQWVRDRLPHERVGVIGVSLGGAATLLGAEPLPVDALVLESVFPDIDAALTNRLHRRFGPVWGPLVTPVLAPLLMLLMPPILGVRPEALRPVEQIGSVTAPVLVASGTADRGTTLPETEALFRQAPEPKHLWTVQGAGHVDLERFDPDPYWAVVLPFLTKYLRIGELSF